MSESTPSEDVSNAPKFHTDRRHYGPALEQWFARHFPDRTDATVTDIEIPVATGVSNETVLFDMAWSADGVERTDRFVARIEPTGGALFPAQTAHCAVSVEVQHRAMTAVRDHATAPVPEFRPADKQNPALPHRQRRQQGESQ